MKLSVIFTLGLAAVVAHSVAAADLDSYTATADPNLNPDGMDQNGNMVDVWTFSHTGDGTAPNDYGSFLGDSGQNGGGSGAGAGTSAWGIYADQPTAGDFNNEADIGHTFDGGSLSIGQSVSINFDAGYVDTGGSYGIRLFGSAGFTLAFSFSGGDSLYRYYDGTTSGNSSGVGYDPNGFNFDYTQTGATTYSVLVTDTTGILGSFSGTVSGSPDFIQVYNSAAGSGSNYDVFANNLQIVPEPSALALLICGGGLGLILLRAKRRISA